MTRPSLSIQLHKDELITLYTSGHALPHLCTHLQQAHCITCSKATLQRTIHAWGIYKRPRRSKCDHVKQLILDQFYKHMASDEEMLRVIVAEGYSMSMRALQRLRRELGCLRRAEEERWEGVREALRQQLGRDMLKGEMAGYQHRTVGRHVRGLGFAVGRDRLKSILSEIDPGGAKRRADAGPQRRQPRQRRPSSSSSNPSTSSSLQSSESPQSTDSSYSPQQSSQSPIPRQDLDDHHVRADLLLSAAGVLDRQGCSGSGLQMWQSALSACREDPCRGDACGGGDVLNGRACVDPALSA